MGKIRRGLLWGLFPPAGAVASMGAGRKKQTKEIVKAIERQGPAKSDPGPAEPAVTRSPEQTIRFGAVRQHRKEIENRLRAAGVTIKAQRMVATMQVMRLVADDGLTIDEAVERVLGWRSEVG